MSYVRLIYIMCPGVMFSFYINMQESVDQIFVFLRVLINEECMIAHRNEFPLMQDPNQIFRFLKGL